jgi:hypothetical protein
MLLVSWHSSDREYQVSPFVTLHGASFVWQAFVPFKNALLFWHELLCFAPTCFDVNGGLVVDVLFMLAHGLQEVVHHLLGLSLKKAKILLNLSTSLWTKLMDVENHIKTYTWKTLSSHFSNIRTKTERPRRTFKQSVRAPVLKMSFQMSAFSKVEHTKLKPYLAKIPRTDCLWCDKKILEMRPPKSINIVRKNWLRFQEPSTAFKKSTGRASVRQSWSKHSRAM